MAVRWRLYYQDGTTFSNEDGDPQDSPPMGVVALLQPGASPEIMVNADWLLYRTDFEEWAECGSDGMEDHAVLWGDRISAFRKTLWIRRPDFEEIWARMRSDLAELVGG